MADGGLIDIVLPGGAQATVPEDQLSQAVDAGAKVKPQYAPGSDAETINSTFGQVGTAGLAAARAATFGLSDTYASEVGNIAGGEGLRRQTLKTLDDFKTSNPYADMAGETLGLVAGGTLGGIGEAAGEAGTAAFGKGLLGTIGSGAVRGGVEGAYLGAQHSITEDTLGDHALNGEKLFQSMGKDALLGGALGGAFSAAGYGLGKLLGRGAAIEGVAAEDAAGLAEKTPLGAYRRPGPMSGEVADELAGAAEGGGRRVESQMSDAQRTIEELQKTGLTSEQATSLADQAIQFAQKGSDQLSKLGTEGVDEAAKRYASMFSNGNPERAAVFERGFKQQAKLLSTTDDVIEGLAVKVQKSGTSAMRDLQGVLDDVQFKQKESQFAKMIDPAMRATQRDAVTAQMQTVDEALKFWESTASRGGAEGAVKSIRKQFTDVMSTLAKGEPSGKDLFMRTNELKQALDRVSRLGQNFGLPEAVDHSEFGFRPVADRLRSMLESEETWGAAGAAQRRQNETFSNSFARRQHFEQTVGSTIDRQRGAIIPEVDFSKAKSMLQGLSGGETDELLQSVKSTRDYIDGARARLDAIRETADLSPSQAKQLAKGEASLKEFETAFNDARKEAAAANAVKSQQLLERETPGLGGLLGLVGDVASKPLTTMQRLADVRRGIDGFTGTMKKAASALSEWKATTGAAGAAAAEAAPRTKDVVAKEIGQIKELAANPEALQDRVTRMTAKLGNVAPKIAAEVQAAATRAITYLAREAPQPAPTVGILGIAAMNKPRFSDQQVSDWEAKRVAALGAVNGQVSGAESVIADARTGKLNRNAIQALQFVSPKLFMQLQSDVQEELQRLASTGKLDTMPMAQQAVISSLLQVPAGAIWQPDFMGMMQAAKSEATMPKTGPAPVPQANQGVSKRAIQVDTSALATGAGAIEGRQL